MTVVSLLGALMCAVGLVGLIRPMPWIAMRTRGRAGLIGVVGFGVAIVVVSWVELSPGSANERRIWRADYGDRWPFTVEEGILSCRGASSSIVFTVADTSYAVRAELDEHDREEGYVALDPIRRVAPDVHDLDVLTRLDEDIRRELFAAMVACDDIELPLSLGTYGRWQSDPSPRVECRAALREKAGLSAEEMSQVSLEGAGRSWPPLSPSWINIGVIITDGLALCS